MLRPVKAITQRDPAFLKMAYKHGNLINLQNDERFIDEGERYLVWRSGLWRVMRKQHGVGVFVGSSPTLHRAVYIALI